MAGKEDRGEGGREAAACGLVVLGERGHCGLAASSPALVSCVAGVGGGNDFQWCFSQVKGAIDEDVAEGGYSVTGTQQLF